MTTNASQDNNTEEFQQYRTLLNELTEPIFVLEKEDAFVFVNEAFRDLLDIERDLIGLSFQSVAEAGPLPPGSSSRIERALANMDESDTTRQEFVLEQEGEHLLEITLDRKCFDKSDVLLGQVHRISEEQREMNVIKRQREALFRLYEIEIRDDLSTEEKIQETLDVGRDFFDLPIGFLTSIDGSNHRVMNSTGSEELTPGTDHPLEQTYCRLIMDGNDPLVLQNAEDELGADDPAYKKHGFRSYIGTRIPFGSETYGTYCFSNSESRDRSFTKTEKEFIQLLGLWAGQQLQRQFFEDMLREASNMGRQMMMAESDQQIGSLLLDAVDHLQEMHISVCFRLDEQSETLRPIAERSPASGIDNQKMRISSDDKPHWQSFEHGDIRTFEQMASDSSENREDSPIQSVIHVPIGNRGLLVAASTKYETVPPIHLESFQLLSDTTRDAFINLDRQEQLRERGKALQRQNERLEEFAGLVAHDLRNPLSGAVGFLEIARETGKEIHFDQIETSLERMQNLVQKLLGLARGTEENVEPTDVDLEQVIREAWSYLDTADADLVVNGTVGWIHADETRLLQLFGNLFRNSLEHAGEDVTIEVGSHPNGFYVQDDGPGLTEDVREDILNLEQTSSEQRPGLGLKSVTDIVRAHDWTIRIPETEEGVRFEIYTRSTDG